MEVLALAVMGAVNILCFMVGAKVGQKVEKGEKVELPSFDPMKAYQEHRESKEAKAKQDVTNAILHNIDIYDGTEVGQADVPRG